MPQIKVGPKKGPEELGPYGPELQIVPTESAPELDPDAVKEERKSVQGILETPTEELPWVEWKNRDNDREQAN